MKQRGFIYKTSKDFDLIYDKRGNVIGRKTQEEMIKEVNSQGGLLGTCIKVECVL